MISGVSSEPEWPSHDSGQAEPSDETKNSSAGDDQTAAATEEVRDDAADGAADEAAPQRAGNGESFES